MMEHSLQKQSFPLTVEVGAGDGQHLNHVKHSFQRYLPVDIRYTQLDLAGGENSIPIAGDAEKLPFKSESVDRLVSTCVLHHLSHPLEALQEWRSAVRIGGCITIFLPSDPGAMWRLGRFFTTRRLARKLGVDWELFIATEHRNHAASIMTLIERVFQEDLISRNGFPFKWRTWNLNLGWVYQITKTTA